MHVAYLRISTKGQSLESQRFALGGHLIQQEFMDEGVSGSTLAMDRPGFRKMMEFIREGDTLHVAALDRLGRDAIDVQHTVKTLLARKVKISIQGLDDVISGQTGGLIVAVLAQIAEMDRSRILEKTAAGRAAAKESLAKTGKTQHGKKSLGRPTGSLADGITVDPVKVAQWRKETGASIKATAEHWGIGTATVKRYSAAAA